MCATGLYLIIDLEDEALEFATAGHPMPIVVKDGSASILSSERIVRGPALGLVPEAPYGADKIPLSTLDQIVLFTDGIYEIENEEGEEFGLGGMLKALTSGSKESGSEALGSLLTAGGEHAGSEG